MRSARTHHLFGINASSVYPKCIIRFGRNGDASFYTPICQFFNSQQSYINANLSVFAVNRC